MKNFKEIVEKCLTGELSGTFVLRNGDTCISSNFKKDQSILTSFRYLENFYYSDHGHCYISTGHEPKFDIVEFIPNMQEQIKIDIPKDKVPVMEQTENGIVITWKEKELTYEDIVKTSKGNFPYSYVRDLLSLTGQQAVRSSAKTTEDNFYKKVEVLRKLTNIRNYFGKPNSKEVLSVGWCINSNLSVTSAMPAGFGNVVFLKKEHAEQAVKMLGDELKYLFEPW